MSVVDQAAVSHHEPLGSSSPACPRRPPAALRAAQILSVLMALPMTVGSFVFAVITPDHHYAAWVTWTLAPIAFATGVGLLSTAPRLARTGARGRVTMLRLLAAAQAFSVVKLTVFHEGASVPFLALSLAVLALLCTPGVRAYLAAEPPAHRR